MNKCNFLRLLIFFCFFIGRQIGSSQADIVIGLSPSTNIANIGEFIDFQIVAKNNGQDELSGITIQIDFSTGLNFTNDNAPQGTDYDAILQIWRIENPITSQDSLVLNLQFEITATSTHFLIAEVIEMNEIDVNSTPNNQHPLENDYAVACITTPILINTTLGDSVVLQAPNQLTNGHQWWMEVNGSMQVIATDAVFAATEPGSYYYQNEALDCEPATCCPIILEALTGCITTLLSVDCEDNGTIDDTTDDTFSVTLQADGYNVMTDDSYLVRYDVSVFYLGEATFGTPLSFSHPDFLADGISTFTIQVESEDISNCNNTITITAPSACSFSGNCDFHASLIESGCCNACIDGNLRVITEFWKDEYQYIQLENLALNKPTLFNGNPQTNSDYSNITVDGLLEGNTSSSFDYAFTPTGIDNFWSIDLYGFYDIETIRIFHQSGSNFSNANQYQIFITDTPFMSNDLNVLMGLSNVENFTIPISSATNPIELSSINAQGRFVRIYLEGLGRMKLTEVEIIGSGNTNSSPYQYQWNDTAIGNNASPTCLDPGDYEVIVSDIAKGCMITKGISIN